MPAAARPNYAWRHRAYVSDEHLADDSSFCAKVLVEMTRDAISQVATFK